MRKVEAIIPNGPSFKFYRMRYKNSNQSLRIGDEVIIHPVPGRSQAKESYPAKVIVHKCVGVKHGNDLEFKDYNELCAIGIRENSTWHGAVINEYLFNRLEFVKRSTSDC